jgi:hypothetical protein
MAVLHQYNYIFAIAMLFAFLDAWNIGTDVWPISPLLQSLRLR